MRRCAALLCVFLLVFTANPTGCFACTSFAVYSQKTYYGMNFDHSVDAIRFSIRTGSGNGDIRVFSMDFSTDGGYHPTVAINNRGLFAACQMAYPEHDPPTERSDSQVDMFGLFADALLRADRVSDIRDAVSGKAVVCRYNFVHTLYADSSGDALVLETDNSANWITDISGRSMVMTNFFNHRIGDTPIETITGAGVDRYLKAAEYIDANLDGFSYADGMRALQETVQADGPDPTQCSLLFDPTAGEIFIVVKQDFARVWRVFISDGTIETFSGFDSARSAKIGSRGFLMQNLDSIGTSSTAGELGAVVSACCLFVVALAALAVRRARSKAGVLQ